MTPPGIEPVTFRFVAQHLNHCNTAVPRRWWGKVKYKVHLTSVTRYRHKVVDPFFSVVYRLTSLMVFLTVMQRAMGRPGRKWVGNIRTDLQELGCGYMDWIGLVQDRDRWRTLVSAVMNLRVPWNAWNFLTSCKPVSFSRRTLHHGVSK